jgi:phosphoribosylformimino-5-aminoimidazole carboxamide ribotide isomerase
MIIIPAIDIRGGNCVRLTEGDYNRETVYEEDPVAVARRFKEAGARWLHVVDLDGAKEGRPNYTEIASRIVRETKLRVEFGGGVRTLEAARKVLSSGVNRVVMGSVLAKNPELADEIFHSLGHQAVAGIDEREGKVATDGWTETTEVSGVEFAQKLEAKGCPRIVYTDISRDGTLAGPNLEALSRMVEAVKIPVVASGGVSCEDDLKAIEQTGAEAVIVGKAIYEGKIDLEKLFSA